MDRILVLAGNYEQFEEWLREQRLSESQSGHLHFWPREPGWLSIGQDRSYG